MTIKRTLLRIVQWAAALLLVLLILLATVLGFFMAQAGKRESISRTDAAPKTGHFIRTTDVEMYVQEWGPKTGMPVVLVHAAGGWSGVWEKTAIELSAEGYRVIAVDMPPLGFSERPQNADYSRDAQAKRLIGVLDDLLIPKAVFVGHSFGARAVAQAALTHPERVSGVVFVDAALSLQPSKPSTLLNIVMSTSLSRRAVAAATLTNPLFTKTLLDMFVADPESATPYWVSLYQAAMNVKGTTAAVADWLPELLTAQDSSVSSNPDWFKKIQAPTLVLWGDADTVTPLSQGEYLASLIPHSQLVTLPGIGHLPPIEDTSGFDKALLAYLNQLR
ncbi:alpha/beta hydrolase [Candidatus Kaiserbacteria bacterium]|nr:alpha/beta hydrolase [Candidatus Kaiserbacteria bacterium]